VIVLDESHCIKSDKSQRSHCPEQADVQQTPSTQALPS
jgi:hypothetical protein